MRKSPLGSEENSAGAVQSSAGMWLAWNVANLWQLLAHGLQAPVPGISTSTISAHSSSCQSFLLFPTVKIKKQQKQAD